MARPARRRRSGCFNTRQRQRRCVKGRAWHVLAARPRRNGCGSALGGGRHREERRGGSWNAVLGLLGAVHTPHWSHDMRNRRYTGCALWTRVRRRGPAGARSDPNTGPWEGDGRHTRCTCGVIVWYASTNARVSWRRVGRMQFQACDVADKRGTDQVRVHSQASAAT